MTHSDLALLHRNTQKAKAGKVHSAQIVALLKVFRQRVRRLELMSVL
jgi:hypothetical protein